MLRVFWVGVYEWSILTTYVPWEGFPFRALGNVEKILHKLAS